MRLRLAVPEPHPTLRRLTHDDRIMGQIEQLGLQLQVLLVPLALGDVGSVHNDPEDLAVDDVRNERHLGVASRTARSPR